MSRSLLFCRFRKLKTNLNDFTLYKPTRLRSQNNCSNVIKQLKDSSTIHFSSFTPVQSAKEASPKQTFTTKDKIPENLHSKEVDEQSKGNDNLNIVRIKEFIFYARIGFLLLDMLIFIARFCYTIQTARTMSNGVMMLQLPMHPAQPTEKTNGKVKGIRKISLDNNANHVEEEEIHPQKKEPDKTQKCMPY